MTISQFRKSPALTAALAELMANKTLRTALDAIRDEAILKSPPPAIPGVHQDTVTAHHIYRQFGVMHVMDTLDRMTRDGKSESAEEEEFSHAIPDELKPKL